MSEQIFIRLRGRIQGPFTSDQLHVLARRGQFSRTHEVSADGVQWSRASTRPELFSAAVAERAPVAPETPDAQFSPSAPPQANVPPPSDVWYYRQLGTNHGPVDFNHLQYLANSGQILPEDVVWKEGLPEWIAAGRVPGLFKTNTGPPNAFAAPVYVGINTPPQDLPRVSGFAVASLVLGLLWLWGVGSILAIVFGTVALNQIRVGRGRVTGTGMAIAGLILGIVFLGLQILWVILMGVAIGSFAV